MGNDELLNHLVKVPIQLLDDGRNDDSFVDRIELWALPEPVFHEVTKSSCDHVVDGTGTRPYSGAMVFLQFCRAYPDMFVNETYRLVELGAGIGACGVMLAMARRGGGRQHVQDKQNVHDSNEPTILLTDGEPLTVEIARRNCALLGLTQAEIDVRVLQWSEDSEQIRKVARLHSFHHVIGTDLLYYRTCPRALLATAEALLAKEHETSSESSDRVSSEGAIFLPALVRTPSLADDLVTICNDLNLIVHILPIESFYVPVNPILYNVSFLIVTRKGATLEPALCNALRNARLFDPHEDTDDDAPLPLFSD
jgi:hypothetical protein